MIIVGIPSYNEADNIEWVVKRVSQGLKKYFPGEESLIVNLDNNSNDGTKEVFLKIKTSTPKVYISTPAGLKGKGHNLYNLFKFIKKQSSKINIVLDADLKSIEPDWIRKLGTPVKGGYDFVAPFYTRNKRDALITKNFCYPLVYGLLGWDIRQPIGGDFAFSLKMVKHWLSKKWLDSVYQYGIDIFITTEVILNNFKICQVDLGRKVHRASQGKLESMFVEITEVLFNQLINYKKSWLNQRIRKPKVFYRESTKNPQPLNFDLRRFGKNEIGPDLWSKIVYDHLDKYEGSKNKEKLIRDLKTLAFDRFQTYIKSVERLNFREAEKEVINQAKIFRKNRDYLLTKDRFNLSRKIIRKDDFG